MRSDRLITRLCKGTLIVLLLAGFLGNSAGNTAQVLAQAGSPSPFPSIYSPGPPFADMTVGNYPGIALGDIDKDGRIDALAGDQLGQITYYHNGGGENLGSIFYREALSKYPDGLNINLGNGNPSSPSKTIPHPELFDYNGDGNLDLFVAGWNSNPLYGDIEKPAILYFERQADKSFLQISDNPLSRIPGPTMLNLSVKWLTITVGNLNNDSLPDAVVGYFQLTSGVSGNYHISVFINNGPGVDPTLLDPNPFPESSQSFTQKGSPRLVDINGDGLLDLFVGFGDGSTAYYQNTGTASAPLFTEQLGPANPLNPPGSSADLVGPDVGRDAVPSFANLDGDADLDALIASADGRVSYFRNDGTSNQPAFSAVSDVNDPFRGLDGGLKNSILNPGGSTITFGDLNGDGIPDALAGGVSAGEIRSFIGNKVSPSQSDIYFRELAGGEKWFSGPNFSSSQPILVDLDHNGSLDLLIAAQNLAVPNTFTIYYYKNTSAPPAAPNFILQTGADDPFSAIGSFPDDPIATVGDFDKDGLLDLLIGGSDGKIVYFRLVGPQFTQVPANQNPFQSVNIPYAAPFLGDVDGDGNLDLLIGEGRRFVDSDPNKTAGTIHYFQHRKAGAPPSNPLFSEQTGYANPFYWFSTREFANPVLADLTGDQVPDLVSGSGFGTFFFYPHVGTTTSLAYRDYEFNPLANGTSPTPGQSYPLSINLVDYNGDQLQDAFIGTPNIGGPSRLLFYRNIGTNHSPVFRRQPDNLNPLLSASSPDGLINVSFGDTDGNGILEAYVGGVSGGTPFIKFFERFGSNMVENPDTLAAQFPKTFALMSDLGPRLQFVRRPGSSLLDAYIYLGLVASWKGVYYATNSGNSTDPTYTYGSLNEWVTGPNNPFYHTYQAGTIEAGFNTAWVSLDTLWVGNSAGEIYTMKSTFFDPAANRNYIDRVDSPSDLFYQVHLPGPTVVSSSDVNGDGIRDGFVSASDGAIHYIRSSGLSVFLPYTQR